MISREAADYMSNLHVKTTIFTKEIREKHCTVYNSRLLQQEQHNNNV